MALNSYYKNAEPVSTDFGMIVRLVTPTTAIPVTGTIIITDPTSNTSAITYPAATGANQTLLAANANRKGLVIVNDSGNVLYVKLGVTASASSYTYRLAPNSNLDLPNSLIWTGQVDAFMSAASGNIAVTELT